MSNELPWPERVNMLAVNPDVATRHDVARMASELGEIEMKRLLALPLRPDIECKNCGWQGFTDNDTPEGGLLKIYKGDEGWDAYDPIDDPDGEGIWVCPKCFLPEDSGIMSI